MNFIPFPDIVGPTYTLASLNAECQRCVNLQIETIESGKGANSSYLRETPGLKLFFQVSAIQYPFLVGFPIRGMHTCGNGRVFVAIRYSILEVFSDGTSTLIFTWNNEPNGTGKNVRFADNQYALAIMLDFTGIPNTFTVPPYTAQLCLAYIRFSLTPAHPAIIFTDFGFSTQNGAATNGQVGLQGTKYIDILDGYFIVPQLSTYDATTNSNPQFTPYIQQGPYEVQDFAKDWSSPVNLALYAAQSSSDNINRIIVNGREIWIFGISSYEVFYNTGDSESNLERIRDAAYPIGCIAPDSVTILQSKVFWLGSSADGYGMVFMSNGLQAQRISTTAIERIIRSLAAPQDAYAWTYQVTGHIVYVITFPDDKITLAYDMATNSWNERKWRDPNTGVESQHRGQFSVFAFGKNLVSDYETGLLYELSEDTYTDNGAQIIRYRRAPVLANSQKFVFHNRLEFDMQVGVGLYEILPPGTPNQGQDPLIFIRWSDDNGYTWSNYHNTQLGKMGQYKKRIIFNRLGVSRKRVYEVYLSDPVPFRMISAEIGITNGVH